MLSLIHISVDLSWNSNKTAGGLQERSTVMSSSANKMCIRDSTHTLSIYNFEIEILVGTNKLPLFNITLSHGREIK